jgi:integrase
VVLRPFRRWAGEDRLLAEITRRDVELDFLPEWSLAFELRRGHPPSVSYLRALLLSIRGLFAFADEFDLLVDRDGNAIRNPLRHLEVPAASVPGIAALSPEAEANFLAGAKTPRERIISQLLRWTGVRLSEAVGLLDDDVDLARREVRVRRSKTARGVRTIPLLSQLEGPVEEW